MDMIHFGDYQVFLQIVDMIRALTTVHLMEWMIRNEIEATLPM